LRQNRGKNVDFIYGEFGFKPSISTEGVAVDLADLVFKEPAEARGEIRGLEAQNFH